MNEVTELAGNEIDRSGSGVSTGNGYNIDSTGQPNASQQPAAAMTPAQTQGIADLATMRQRAADPSLDSAQRAGILARMAELAKFTFQGGKQPSWYGQQAPSARDTSNEPADDGIADVFAGANETMTQADREALVQHAKVKSLSASDASAVVEFATQAGLDRTTAKVVTDRFAHHSANGFGMGAQLSPEMQADLAAECVRSFGGVEKAQAEIALAAAYLKHVGLLDWADRHAGSLQYDPVLLTTLAYKARVLGLKAAK